MLIEGERRRTGSTTQAAEMADVTDGTIRRWCADGTLPHPVWLWRGHQIRIDLDLFKRWLTEASRKPTKSKYPALPLFPIDR